MTCACPEVVTSVIKQMEHGAEKRNRKSKGVIPNGRGSDHDNPGPSEEPVDLLIKLASKLRLVKDRLHVSASYCSFGSRFSPSQRTRQRLTKGFSVSHPTGQRIRQRLCQF